MGHLLPVPTDLDAQLVFHLLRQVDRDPQRISHDVEVREDPAGAEKHVALAGDELHRAERLHELLQLAVQVDQLGWPVSEDFVTVTGPTSVALVRPGKATAALRAGP